MYSRCISLPLALLLKVPLKFFSGYQERPRGHTHLHRLRKVGERLTVMVCMVPYSGPCEVVGSTQHAPNMHAVQIPVLFGPNLGSCWARTFQFTDGLPKSGQTSPVLVRARTWNSAILVSSIYRIFGGPSSTCQDIWRHVIASTCSTERLATFTLTTTIVLPDTQCLITQNLSPLPVAL